MAAQQWPLGAGWLCGCMAAARSARAGWRLRGSLQFHFEKLKPLEPHEFMKMCNIPVFPQHILVCPQQHLLRIHPCCCRALCSQGVLMMNCALKLVYTGMGGRVCWRSHEIAIQIRNCGGLHSFGAACASRGAYAACHTHTPSAPSPTAMGGDAAAGQCTDADPYMLPCSQPRIPRAQEIAPR